MQKEKANIFNGLHDPILANYMHNFVSSNVKFLGIKKSIIKQISLDINHSYRVLSTIPLGVYFEQDVLYGYVLNHLSIDKNNMFYQYLHQYCGKINYYLTCDLFVADTDFKEDELNNLMKNILFLIRSNNPYKIRCGLLLLRKYFIKNNYQDVMKVVLMIPFSCPHIEILKTNILFQIAYRDLDFYYTNISKVIRNSKFLYFNVKEKIRKSSYFSDIEKARLKGL